MPPPHDQPFDELLVLSFSADYSNQTIARISENSQKEEKKIKHRNCLYQFLVNAALNNFFVRFVQFVLALMAVNKIR